MPLYWIKLCGASCRTKNGEPCKQPAMANGRCKMHGGKARIKHGCYTKRTKEERLASRAFIRKMRKSTEFMKEVIGA